MIKLPGNILKSDQRIVTPVSEWSHCKQSKSKYYHINQSRHGHLAHFVHLASFGPPYSSMYRLDTSILELPSSLLVKIQHQEFCSLFLLLFCYHISSPLHQSWLPSCPGPTQPTSGSASCYWRDSLLPHHLLLWPQMLVPSPQ